MTGSVVGFTGTQRGMTPLQATAFAALLATWPRGWFHHGDCVGADAQAHAIALDLGWFVEIHPPSDPKKRAFCKGASVVRPTLPYLVRNQNIVMAAAVMTATPGEFEEQVRSGTWSTVRRARTAERPLVNVYPDGTYVTERWQLPEAA